MSRARQGGVAALTQDAHLTAALRKRQVGARALSDAKPGALLLELR